MPLLEWLTKETGLKASFRVPYRILDRDPALSVGAADTGNMLIRGDNLEALVSLRPSFIGAVRCIFIDPPYNTESAYRHYDDNLEHTIWLSMMYPRLELLRDLLSQDGVLFATIDDGQCHYLKVMMDEIFGRKNFCGSLIWEKKKKPSFLNANFGGVTEYVLAYARNRSQSPPFTLGTTTAGKKFPLNNAGNSLAVLTFPALRVEFGCQDQHFEPQDMSEGNIKTRLLDPLDVVHGRNAHAFRLEGEWRYSQNTLDEILAAGDTLRIAKSPFRPNHIKTGGEPKKMKNLLSVAHYGMSTYEDATAESEALFGHELAFEYPKPEKLVATLIEAVTSPGDLVLDSFLGSGTTAAVAHKLERRYIGIEMGEHAETLCAPRLRKVIEGEQGGISEAVSWKGGGGFDFFRLGESVFDEYGRVNRSVTFEQLAAHVWFTETRAAFNGNLTSPHLGSHGGVAYYLLYNGVLGDRRPEGGNVLTSKTLSILPPYHGPKIVYGETSRLSRDKLRSMDITFKQIPYDLKAR